MNIIILVYGFSNGEFAIELNKHHVVNTYGAILISALDGGMKSASCTGRCTRGEIGPGTHGVGGWLGPRTCLDDMEKKKSCSSEKCRKKKTLLE
jgi:hypothetical protein